MNTKEFLDQDIESIEVRDVPTDRTCLVMLTKLANVGTFNVIGSRHDIELEHYNRVFLLDEPPVLAKDLEHGTVFVDNCNKTRCRVRHKKDDQCEIFAPYTEIIFGVNEKQTTQFISPDCPCTIVKEKE